MQVTETKWTWFERHFNFDFPPEKMPDIVERLRGTPPRARHLVDGLPQELLTRREGDTWSIQENVAHIYDLEPLWFGRIEDILAGHEEMRAADLTNQTTFKADHHAKSVSEVLELVAAERSRLVERLESLSPNQWGQASLHPRLKKPMRVVDLCYFVADHDDYHLARATHLKKSLANS